MQAHETSRCAAIAQPWFAPVSTSALANEGDVRPGTRDGFDRHDILPTRPRGQTPRGDAPSSTRVQSEANASRSEITKRATSRRL